MNDSTERMPTPRTDAVVARHADEHNESDRPVGYQYCELADHARALEREIAAQNNRLLPLVNEFVGAVLLRGGCLSPKERETHQAMRLALTRPPSAQKEKP